MTDLWDELWKEEKYMTSEDVPTDFYNLMLKVKAEGDKLKYYADWVKRLENFDRINFHQRSMALEMSVEEFLEMKEKAEKFDYWQSQDPTAIAWLLEFRELKGKLEAINKWIYKQGYSMEPEEWVEHMDELKDILEDQASSQSETK